MKAIYLSLGVLFGGVLAVSPVAWGSASKHHLEICLRLYGPFGGITFALLPMLPVIIADALFFGWIGYRLGRKLEDASKRRSISVVEDAVPGTNAVWPPPPQAQVKGHHDAA